MFVLRRGPGDPWLPGRWNLPGGVAEDGETIEAAARRECLEEAGVEPLEIIPLGVFHADCCVHAFTCSVWSGLEPRITDDESDDSAWVSGPEGRDWVPVVADLLGFTLPPLP